MTKRDASPNIGSSIIYATANRGKGETQTGINKIVDELKIKGDNDFNVYSKHGKTANNGGFNFLQEDLNDLYIQKKKLGWNDKEIDDFIWQEYNEPWLREALVRGDDFALISDPTIADGFYKRELNYIKDYIKNNPKCGYNFDEAINTGKLIKK